MSRWFRFYDDALNDPKVQSLPPALFKFWVNLLCIASRNGGAIPRLDDLKASLKARLDHVEAHLSELIKRGLVDDVGGVLEPHNWRKRQYKSDNSTERVRRHRNVSCTVSETPPETDTESETDISSSLRSEDSKNSASAKSVEVSPAKPVPRTRGMRLPADWHPGASDLAEALHELGSASAAERELKKFRDYWAAAPGARGVKLDWDATWRNWVRKAGETPRRSTGPPQRENFVDYARRNAAIAAGFSDEHSHNADPPEFDLDLKPN